VAAISLAAGLAGCAVGPSTSVRTMTAPVAARTAHATDSASRTFLDSLRAARDADRPDSASRTLWKPTELRIDQTRDLAWLDVLRDSQLVALVRTAVANNRDLRVAQARVREYRGLFNVARAPLFPQITANASDGRTRAIIGENPPLEYNAIRLTGDVSWELDFFGRLRRQTQAARYDLEARDEDLRATVLTLISDVATAYLQLREADENLNLAQQTLASRQATLDIARRRFNQGVISELDVRQFEAQVADPAARVADFARQRTAFENQLAYLVGASPGPIARGRPLEDVVQSVTVPDSLPGDLISRRPDVMGALRDWQAAKARVGVAIGSRLPSVLITSEYGSQRPEFNNIFTQQGAIYTVQAGVSLPLFTGGRLRGNEQAARARADQAQARYEQTVLGALRESSDALAGVRLGRDQLVAEETQVRALEAAYAIARRRYESGVSSYLDVLDVQRSLFTAQLTLVQTEQQYLASVVQLYRALGGSWNGSAIARSARP
jgi:multidrug efflux system outer membrane protein